MYFLFILYMFCNIFICIMDPITHGPVSVIIFSASTNY